MEDKETMIIVIEFFIFVIVMLIIADRQIKKEDAKAEEKFFKLDVEALLAWDKESLEETHRNLIVSCLDVKDYRDFQTKVSKGKRISYSIPTSYIGRYKKLKNRLDGRYQMLIYQEKQQIQ